MVNMERYVHEPHEAFDGAPEDRKEADDVATLSARWVALAKMRRVQEALDGIEMADLPEPAKEEARIRIFHHAGDNEGAAKLLRAYLEESRVKADSATYFATIAYLGGDLDLASALVGVALDRVKDESELRALLEIATEMRDADMVEKLRSRLGAHFPQSEGLDANTEARLLQLCERKGDNGETAPITQVGFAEHHAFIANTLQPGVSVDYEQYIAEFIDRWSEHDELARISAAKHAEASGQPGEAIAFAASLVPESRFSRTASYILLRVMRALFLAEAVERDALEIYKVPLASIIEHLGRHPEDAELRASLVKTLSVEYAGQPGFALLISVALDFARSTPHSVSEATPVTDILDAEFDAFMQRVSRWLDATGVLDPSADLPDRIVGTQASGISRRMLSAVESAMKENLGPEEEQLVEYLLHLLPPLNKHVDGGTDDIRALRVYASTRAVAGDHQLARDRAELILQIAGPLSRRRCLAWAAYGDIYLRTQGFPDAILGFACAASTQAELPAAEALNGVYTLLRIARDLNLPEVAESAMIACRELCDRLDVPELVTHRLDVTQLSMRVRTVPRRDVLALESLLRDSQQCVEDAFRLGDEVRVAGAIFVQVAGLFERAGGQLPAAAGDVRERVLTALDGNLAVLLRAMAKVRPNIGDLVSLHNALPTSRYSHDAPVDATWVSLAAQRLLVDGNSGVTPQEAFLAAELLAERGVTLAQPRAALTMNWPIQYAQTLVDRGAAVLMLALDDNYEFVAAIADSTGAYVARPPTKGETARKRIGTWSENYPYRYGLIEPRSMIVDERSQRKVEVGDREFYESMRDFDIPLPQGKRVLVIAEPDVAQLTFNLIVKSGELAGYETALGIVPSLTWLAAVQSQPLGRDGRRLAWISEGGGSADLSAMEVVRAQIEEPLARHGVSLDTSKSLIEGAQGAQMAVIVAHGQLTSDKKYIHRIVDEGDLQDTPMALAQALAKVELVILFVCSGGRVDSHPMVNTTVGLPKMLLDRGCRAVVASPWPLESLAPGAWLPPFLDAWENGSTVLDACYEANQSVARRRDREPQVSLAMTVYGDPLLRKARPV
ncbi:CHAT domain [Burkholderia pseudomallei]|nr:CHAT domain [Burkholderia pseudomallei]